MDDPRWQQIRDAFQPASFKTRQVVGAAEDAIASLQREMDERGRKLSCGYGSGRGRNCGECLDCLTVNWYFAQEALARQREV